MFHLLAHAGHSHDMNSMNAIDHCMPILVTAGLVILVLLGVIVYFLSEWQPKKPSSKKKNKK